MALKNTKAWKSLQDHHTAISDVHMRDLFAGDSQRHDAFSIRLDDLLLDYSKNRITTETMGLLLDLAHEQNLPEWIEKLFTGEKINSTEHRAVLHTALRNGGETEIIVDGADVMPEVRAVLERMRRFCHSVRSGDWKGHTGKKITDIVNIGIGGSELGPHMVVDALKPYQAGLRVHFVSNVDGSHVCDTLETLSPETTLFIISSKSFTSQETIVNAAMAKAWIEHDVKDPQALSLHFVAATANIDAALEFGIERDNIFQFWKWVGGRYSLCSSVGLVVALAIGMENFEEFLSGAHKMDMHFRNTPLEQNMPVILAMLGIWYINFFDTETFSIIPYDQHLHLFPFWLQQTDMESNGKRVTRAGDIVDYATSPVVWGEAGVNGQHSFYQLLHQGTHLIPMDFIAGVEAHHPLPGHQKILLANFLAQSKALMEGCDEATTRKQLQSENLTVEDQKTLLPHRTFSGNVPSNTLLYKKLTPEMMGMLVALYEHKVFVQGVIWEINSFDQWGVDLGKKLVTGIYAELESEESITEQDASTAGLLRFYREVADD